MSATIRFVNTLLASTLLIQAVTGDVHASGREPRRANEHQATESNDDAILGRWQRNAGEAVVEFQRTRGGFRGVVVASPRRPELVGTELFRALEYDAHAKAWVGRVFHVDRNREFDAKISLSETGDLVLVAGIAFLRRRVEFHRAEAPREALASRGSL